MKKLLKLTGFLIALNVLFFSGCVTSKTKPILQSVNDGTEKSTATIFLLERDLPQDIERLGVVAISVQSRPTLNVDRLVKDQLQKECQRLGANGAYRVNDGTYYPFIVNYLVFRYKK